MSTSRFSASLTVLAAALVLTGTASAQLVLCPSGPCTGVDPGTRPRPAQYNSPPDMAVQFSSCLGSTSGAFLAENVRASLIGAMQELDSNHDDPPPNPDVRHMQATLLVLANGFLATMVDEPGQEIALGGSIFTSRAARERLRTELRRIHRAVLGVRA